MRDRWHDMGQTVCHLAVLTDFVPLKRHDLARHIAGHCRNKIIARVGLALAAAASSKQKKNASEVTTYGEIEICILLLLLLLLQRNLAKSARCKSIRQMAAPSVQTFARCSVYKNLANVASTDMSRLGKKKCARPWARGPKIPRAR